MLSPEPVRRRNIGDKGAESAQGQRSDDRHETPTSSSDDDIAQLRWLMAMLTCPFRRLWRQSIRLVYATAAILGMVDNLDEAANDLTYWLLILAGLAASVVLLFPLSRLFASIGILPESMEKHGALGILIDNLPDAMLGLIAAIPTFLMSKYAEQKKRLGFARLEFYKCINFSLNWFEQSPQGQKTLMFSTLLEVGLDELVFKNPLVIDYAMRAAAHTTETESFLFRDRQKMDEEDLKQLFMPLIKAATNIISCRFSAGTLAHFAGNTCKQVTLVFGFTCERGPLVPQTKIRVMLCDKDTLQWVREFDKANPNADAPVKFLAPTHRPRWDCLKQMAEILERDPKLLGKVRIYVPRSQSTL